ncbi:RELT-like protein 2 isoform X2 [Mugil cephalus]|uniref:RELT-like protein 2 isoform X2 n=1 Tax=Mugil cephalus TaxID=48193 RepID=UPI001FB691CD|nr:RELT-like protein 2 isoform X2 [Mugil cephalus]
MTELETSGGGEHPPPYIIFLVVFLFFLTGLLGFLICHLLKKKGYRCRTGDMDDEEEEEEEKLEENADDEDEENQDTVEQILKCIIENEANMEAFNEMLGNHNVCVRHDPRLRKESIGGVPPHHHTVHSGTDHNSCHLCAQERSKKGRRQSRIPRSKQRPGEQTVFSVGRFRVIHTDKKVHGSPNPLAISGDQLDQSQDSEERKVDGYNLRSMFKDVRLPSESVNGDVNTNRVCPPVEDLAFRLRTDGTANLNLLLCTATSNSSLAFSGPLLKLSRTLRPHSGQLRGHGQEHTNGTQRPLRRSPQPTTQPKTKSQKKKKIHI